jgi:AcrR family transcriptional regulator
VPRSTKANADLNRQRLFEEAKRQFASKGFHGTSIAGIAGELGLTKQTLLHHFRSKEQLFSEVLAELASSLAQHVQAVTVKYSDPLERFINFVLGALDQGSGVETLIVIRELLENRERADQMKNRHLQSYLKSIQDMVKAIPENARLSDAEAFAFFYQLLGATSYFRISQSTLKSMLGGRELRRVNEALRNQLEDYIRFFTARK